MSLRLALKLEPTEISGMSPLLAYFSSSFLFFERLIFKLLFMYKRCLTTMWKPFKFSLDFFMCVCVLHACLLVPLELGYETPSGW